MPLTLSANIQGLQGSWFISRRSFVLAKGKNRNYVRVHVRRNQEKMQASMCMGSSRTEPCILCMPSLTNEGSRRASMCMPCWRRSQDRLPGHSCVVVPMRSYPPMVVASVLCQRRQRRDTELGVRPHAAAAVASGIKPEVEGDVLE